MDEFESVLRDALPRLRPTLVALGMPVNLDDHEATAWLRERLELGWDRQPEPSGVGPV